MEESLECSQDVDLGSGRTQQKKQKPTEAAAAAAAAEASLRCPRCDSTNTKFCYYNNYSKLQPRHYCRACRRHWTAGGTLRSVPVGGNRKNKRLKAKRTASADKGDDLTTAESSSLLPESWNQVSPAPGLEDCYGDGELTTESWMLRAETESWGFYQEDGLPFSAFSSSPCSRSLYDHGDEGLFAMEGSAAQLPAGSLSHWDDILDLVNLELKTPSSDRVDRTLTY